jgi:hypothetical protein
MSRSLPKLHVVNIWTDDLVESSLSVLVPYHVHKVVVDMGSLWKEEARSWGKFVEEEELLISSQFSMISFSCFLLHFLPLLQLLGIWKGNPVDTLKGLTAVCLPFPIARRVLEFKSKVDWIT